MKKAKKIIAPVLALIIFLAVCYYAGDVFMPYRKDYGSTWKSFLQEDKDTIDVLVSGSSLAYCDVIPAIIWENTGITTYVTAGAEQTTPISYYYIMEACKTQKPKAVFLEVSSVYYSRYQEFTKVNIGYMPWSVNRLSAIFIAAEKEERTGLLFPLYNYHYRVFDIKEDEIKTNSTPKSDILAGYTLLTEYKPMGDPQYRGFGEDNDYDRNMQYIEKLAKFCSERDIELYLYLAPSKAILSPEFYERLENDVESIPVAGFIDFNDYINDMGFNDRVDWFDTMHLNVGGAKKFSTFLSGYMKNTLNIEPGNNADAADWNERAEYINTK